MTYEEIKQNPDICIYIQQEDASLGALGFTEHSFAQVTEVTGQAELPTEGNLYDHHRHRQPR